MKKISLAKTIGVVGVFMVAAAGALSAQTLTTLVSFDYTHGSDPAAPLIQGRDGNLYGTTQYGGSASNCESGYPCGTVFKITPSGTMTSLHSFDYGDGAYPVSPLVQGTDGNFYGTNQGEADSGGAGTIFKITPSGTLTVLRYSFSSPAGLVQGRDGNFYGTTPRSYTHGTVFKITPSGTLTTLHTFNGTDGDNPQSGLIQATDGNFYGTTASGGTSSNCGGGCGTVFKITPSGSLTTLHSFSITDGFNVVAGLVQGTDGNFYGTTVNGGGGQNVGEVFKITPSGTLTVLYSFCSQANCTDGNYPKAALMQASDGNFYGTTSSGGVHNQGTVFTITPGGSLTTLYSFCAQTGCADGTTPIAGVIQASNGNFYGTTYNGGSNNSGTVFKLSVSHSTLTVSTNGNGLVTSTDGFISCPGTCSHSYVDNTQVTLNATPASGWAFSGWGGACSGTGSCQVTMTQNTSVSASFYQLPVTLTVSVAGNGSVTSTDHFINCPGTCTHVYDPGTQVTLNAAAASGWAFSGWTGACSGIGSCTVTMTQNFFLTAVFLEPGHGLQFAPVTPCRLVDTRQTQTPIQGGTSQSFIVPQLGNCNIPATAAAYSINVTVVPRHTLGYLTVWPTGEAQPFVSIMNSWDGRVKANAAIVPAGSQGAISVYATDTTDVILDISGYFAAPAAGTYQFFPLTPCRVVDTRQGQNGGTLQAGVERDYTIAGHCGIPSAATGYSFNVTVLPTHGELDYLTVWPKGEGQPYVSTLNDPTGTVVANAAIVPAGEHNATAFYAHDKPTDLLVDVNGYFAPAATGGMSLYPAAPCRVIDTRDSGPPWSGMKPVNVVNGPCAPPSNSQAFVFNGTVVPPGPMLFLTLWPHDEDQPTVSTLNAQDGAVTSNMAIVPTTDGSIDSYAYALTQMILDISGYFAP